MINLSKRLLKICKYINNSKIVFDIGCDHCLLLIYLIKQNKCKKGYGVDNKLKPLEIGQKNVNISSLNNKIKLFHGNGLKPLKNINCDVCVIAGLGCKVILDILIQDDQNIKKYIIVSNSINNSNLRKWIKKNNYFIEIEDIIEENGYYYELIMINKIQGYQINNDLECIFGPYLLNKKLTKFLNKWSEYQNHLQTIMNQIPKYTEKYKQKQILFNKINQVLLQK